MIPVSVVIPCYRCALTIERAVESVDRQTERPVEVILVDDASEDGTLDALNSIQIRFGDWIRIIELPENRGVAAARNAGWNLASQPLIAFLDADDSWHREKLRVQFNYMQDNSNVTVCGHRCLVLSNNETSRDLAEFSVVVSEVRPHSHLFKNPFSTPTVMLKRDIDFRFPEGKQYAEDACLWQTIAFAGLRIVRLEIALAFLHKAAYGVGGLSGDLWRMETGEIDNFVRLWRSGKIAIWMLVLAVGFSAAKFVKRLMLQAVRNGRLLLLRTEGNQKK